MEEWLSFGKNTFENGLIVFLVFSLLLIVVGIMMTRFVTRLFKRFNERQNQVVQTKTIFLEKVCVSLIRFFIGLLILIQIKAFRNITTAFLGASGILAVVIGFAAQESMANMVGGFFLSIYQPFKVGDCIYVKDKDILGTVEEIGFRHTVIRTLQKTTIIVPNSIMNNTIIENRTENEGLFSQFYFISISYDSSVEKAMTLLQEEILKHPLCIIEQEEDPCHLLVYRLNTYSVDLRATIHAQQYGDFIQITSDLNQQLKVRFEQEGICIPYPSYRIYPKSDQDNS